MRRFKLHPVHARNFSICLQARNRIVEAAVGGIAAWEDFVASRKDKPYPRPDVGPEGEGAEKQRMLEEKYFPPEMLGKYKQ